MDLEALAQQRSRWNKFREKHDPFAKAFERKFRGFSPEAAAVLDALENVDTRVRDIAMGLADKTSVQEKAIDAGGEGEDKTVVTEPIEPGQTLRDILRVSQTNFRRREYMTAVSYLGQFHRRMEMIDEEFKQLKNVVDTVHQKFLFEGLDPSHVNYLTKHLGPRFEKYREKAKNKVKGDEKPKKATVAYDLTAEGGVSDWWHNIFDDRGKELSAWEKRFPQYTKALKAQTSSMTSRAQALLENLLTTLKQLDKARAARRIEEYLKLSNRWQDRFRAFHTAFLTFYNSHIRDYIKYKNDLESLKDTEEEDKAKSVENAENAPAKNEPKPYPVGVQELKDALQKATPEQQDKVKELQEKLTRPLPQKSEKFIPLAPLAEDAPLPSWSALPPIFRAEYAKLMANNNTKKAWEQWPEKKQRQLYNMIAMQTRSHQQKEKAAFPPKQETPTTTPVTTPLTTPIPQAPLGRMTEPPSSPMIGVQPHIEPSPAEKALIKRVEKEAPPTFSEDKEPITEVQPNFFIKNPTHATFIAELEAMAAEAPMTQAVKIIRYADSIAEACPDECQRLRILASNILKG